MPPYLGVYVHRNRREIVPYLGVHTRCGGTVVLNVDDHLFCCVRCGSQGMMLPTTTDGEARDNLRRVQAHPGEFDLQRWNHRDFSALVRYLYGDRFELDEAVADGAQESKGDREGVATRIPDRPAGTTHDAT